MIKIEHYNATSILTETCGFLGGGEDETAGETGFTHTLNPAIGCPYGNGFCGKFCYAAQGRAHLTRSRGRVWGRYVDVKANASELLEKELHRAARRDIGHRHHISRLAIFAASSTDPCAGPALSVFRECLRVVARFPIRKFVVQTRSPLVRQLKNEIQSLGHRGVLSFTIETDSDEIWKRGPKGARNIAIRRSAAEEFSTWSTTKHLAVAPCLRLSDPTEFADWIAEHFDYATVDTFVSGDGSPNGSRTARTSLPLLYSQQGWDWRDESQAKQLLELLRERMGDCVAWSSEGFNRLVKI